MPPRWALTRWAFVRDQVRLTQRPPPIQRFLSQQHSVSSGLPDRSLSDNEFLDFVLGPTEDDGFDANLNSPTPLGAPFVEERKLMVPSEPNVAITKERKSMLVGSFRKEETSLVTLGPKSTRRIRWIALRHRTRPSADVSTAWTINYARLTSIYDKEFAQPPTNLAPLRLDERAGVWAEDLLADIDDSTSFEKVGILDLSDFQKRFGESGRGIWREVTLWLLANDKSRVLDFVLATHVGPFYAPMNWVADTLYHLALYYTSNPDDASSDKVRQLIDAFEILSLRAKSPEKMEMRNSFVRRLLRVCDLDGAKKLRHVLKFNEVKVKVPTWHHLSRYFAKRGQVEVAIDAILEAHAKGSNVNSYLFRSNCTLLLRAAMHQQGGQRTALRLVENLLRMGLYLDKQLRGVLMLNAIESGDMNTAMIVYKSMIDGGIKPDAQTYGILLKGCKANLDDAATLTGVIDRAIKEADVRKNPILSTQILHCLCLYHVKYETGFTPIKEAYAQLFDKEPLQRLGIDLGTAHNHVLSDSAPLSPSSHDIAVMLTAYLSMSPVSEAKRIYDRWRALVVAGDPFFAPLATTPYLANTFLYRLVSDKDMLLEGTKVVRDMQTPLPIQVGIDQCPPDVYTWSILVHGFSAFKQTRHAERVLAKMQEMGCRPNTVTWHSLLSGYTSKHNPEGTLDVLRRMEEDGTVYDEWTYRGLSRLSERHRMKVQAEMQKRKYAKSLDFTGQLKIGLTDKLSETESLELNTA